MKVLIADDDPTITEFVSEYLRRWNFIPVIASNGDEALAILGSAQPPRIAILDWMMPGLTGVDICTWLEKEQSVFVYCILLTSRSEKEDLTYALDHGAHQFLNKPIDPDILHCNLKVAKRLIESDDALLRMERIAAIGTLAGGIAHQYNNMNAGILSYIDCLKNDSDLTENNLRTIGKIEGVCKRIEDITQMLLDFANIGTTDKKLLSISELALKAVELEKMKIYNAGITIETDLLPTPLILAEKNSLLQAILHLLINARHALAGVDDAVLGVSCCYEKQKILLKIKDNGCGIAREFHHKIFTPFFTLKGEHAGNGSNMCGFKGYGLGLSVADSIVRHHSGELSLTSEVGKGSEFTITLPVK